MKPQARDLKRIVIANGKELSPEEVEQVNANDFHVVLDCISQILISRNKPGGRKTVKSSFADLGMGPQRLKLLQYMLEHPIQPICMETIHLVYGDISISPEGICKTISRLRKNLSIPDLIVTSRCICLSQTGYAYTMRPGGQYLVIKWQI